MIFKIIGLETFKSKNGNEITKIYAIYERDNISGFGCETFFIMKDNCPSDICLEAKFMPFYGRQGAKGFLAGIQIQ